MASTVSVSYSHDELSALERASEPERKPAKKRKPTKKRKKAHLRTKASDRVRAKIRKLIREGVPREEATAMALRMEREGKLGPKGGYHRSGSKKD